MASLDSETEQSDGHQAADQPHLLLETLVAAAGSSVVFVQENPSLGLASTV